VFVVYDQPAAAGAPRRHAAHPDYPAAEHEALRLVVDYGRAGWRVVQDVGDAARERCWVLRRVEVPLRTTVEVRAEGVEPGKVTGGPVVGLTEPA
jgi:hypothetical protein